jgi:hypothetical protein
MLARNISKEGGCQARGEAIITNTTTATGGEERGEVRVGTGFGFARI